MERLLRYANIFCSASELVYDPSWMEDAGTPTYKYFEPTEEVEMTEEEEPEYPESVYRGRKVAWVGSEGYMMRIPAENVVPLLGNQFYPDQFSSILDYIQNNLPPVYLQAPLARVHTVSQTAVDETQEAAERGDLDEWGMSRPWDQSDIGEKYAVLTNGNHRAFAAIQSGEPYIWVIVDENYRDDNRELLE